MEKEIDLRRLVIKAFHITDVEEGEENKVTASGKMMIEKKILDDILPKYPQLSKLDVQIIKPGEHDRYTNTMMDIIPISTKVLGKIGDGMKFSISASAFQLWRRTTGWFSPSIIWMICRSEIFQSCWA